MFTFVLGRERNTVFSLKNKKRTKKRRFLPPLSFLKKKATHFPSKENREEKSDVSSLADFLRDRKPRFQFRRKISKAKTSYSPLKKTTNAGKCFPAIIHKNKNEMIEISSISTDRMSHGAHFAYHTETVGCIEADTKVKNKVSAQLQAYKTALAAEDQALKISQKSFLTDEITEADTQRDAFYLGLKNTVKAFASIPDATMQQAYKVLSQLLKDYKIDTSMQLDKETGLLINLIGDLEGKYSTEVKALSLNSLVSALKTANEKVRTAMSARNAESSTRQVGAMKAARVAVDEAYRLLIKYVNAYALIEGDTNYVAFVDLMNALIVRYKRQVLGQKAEVNGSGNTGGGEAPNPNPGGGSGSGEAPDPAA